MLIKKNNQYNGIHVFVFCCIDYLDIVNDCVDSIEKHVKDPILSRNIVSNTNIAIPGYTLIKDRDFWKKLDPEFKFRNLYNHNWIKQQIFKLNLDKFVDGDALVVDAEVRFTEDIQWINSTQQIMFYSKYWNDSNEFIRQAINIEADLSRTFVVEAMLFSTDILKEIVTLVEKTNNTSQLRAYQQIIFKNLESAKTLPKLRMSEYDLYANYMIQYHPDKVMLCQKPNEKPFYSIAHERTSNSEDAKTRWATFYEQIRGHNWPDCDDESDFNELPEYIKNECINVFNYKGKLTS